MEEVVYDRDMDSKQDQENQESSDEKETECDSVVLKTFSPYMHLGGFI